MSRWVAAGVVVGVSLGLFGVSSRDLPAQVPPPASIVTPASAVNGAGVALGTLQLFSTTFAVLGASPNGSVLYCSDCTVTTAASCPATQASCVCAGSGTGAFARRVASAWYCTF